EGPLDLIDAVSAPVGHLAARVVSPPHPAEAERTVVWPQFSRSAPDVPVAAFRHRLGGEVLHRLRTGVVDGEDLFQFAELAVADERTAVVVDLHASLLRADLENAAQLASG